MCKDCERSTLNRIDQDIAKGKNIGDLPAETVAIMRELIKDVRFDPDEAIDGATCL